MSDYYQQLFKTLKFPKVKKFVYPVQTAGTSDYTLQEIDQPVQLLFLSLLHKLDSQPQTLLCIRGDSKETIEAHERLIKNQLNNIFIVGSKAKIHTEMSDNPVYNHTVMDKKDEIIAEIKLLIGEVNTTIRDTRRDHGVSGEISSVFMEALETFDLEELNRWKLFFLAFLHNKGGNNLHQHSPFLSATYGNKKFTTAKQFALKRARHNRGFLLLYSKDAGDPYYILTEKMTLALKQMGINWYPDIHNEILLLNGMFPHYLLGIVEIVSKRSKQFIMNPWLHDCLSQGFSFDYRNGLPINQENFSTMAQRLGHKNFFWKAQDGKMYFVESHTDYKPVIQP